FDRLDGTHPLQKVIPKGVLMYPVRELGKGKVVYFNFPLAKEIGLISETSPNQMNASLHEKLIATFSIQIINEFDQSSGKTFPASTIKKNHYMATRYLQLQHSNKKGTTSGDGRSIWNGCIRHRGMTWDISSRGTGVTKLAPGAVEANRPLQTGTTDYGYGCGQAEIDELVSAAIMAEAVHLQGVHTERVLCVIDLGGGNGIGVRAAPNLIRPAHLFLFHKQGRLSELRHLWDYFLSRQVRNGKWDLNMHSRHKHDRALEIIARSFGQFAGKIETDYLFVWMDWDGDNILADAGIIDYGSIRQFGLRHDRYRYDDVDRYSTCLSEQYQKARQMIQVFCQMVDFIKTGRKKSLNKFANHQALSLFDQEYKHTRIDRWLYRCGFSHREREMLWTHQRELKKAFAAYSDIEQLKVGTKLRRVADGINVPPLINARKILREFPDQLFLDAEMLLKNNYSRFAKGRVRIPQSRHVQAMNAFVTNYRRLLAMTMPHSAQSAYFNDFKTRAK
ncbi:MAG TPA: hypothetical protein PLU50_08505, partial [Pseudobdellovibrionaceae bacterium]|nr:hypothetical protein [Pseudobdellovibrionaceae bacterium]